MTTTDEKFDRIESLILQQQTQISQLSEQMTRQNEQIIQQGQRQENILYETQRLLSSVRLGKMLAVQTQLDSLIELP